MRAREPRAPIAGFVLDHGRYRTVDMPGALRTIALGINDRGQVVGGYERSGAVGAAERTAMRSWSRLAELVRAGRPD